MTYVALLRGVNVGGKSIVGMAALRTCFEQLGFTGVKTYINSGNVIFTTPGIAGANEAKLTQQIETTLESHFGSSIKVLLKTHAQLQKLAAAIPADWVNDGDAKCDVMFLWPAIDQPATLQGLPFTPGLEEYRYTSGAIIWRAPKPQSAKTRLTRIIGTPLYRQMTVRNPNTVRKLLALMESPETAA